ncbi:hypothetical protein Cgig2_017647 [Carnegiea gigantea]|uniref:PB1-like domain-containing protein n=1 Tax=Carnegiea gigantea TaxID=171969 RepID=A0A9Q1QFZ9_9CARY|nr:hypothetical protein Cgig2_017647 [Carnegiea gigantea]
MEDRNRRWQFLANYTGELVLPVAIATITTAAEVRTSSRPHFSSLWASTLALLPFIPPSISHIDGVRVGDYSLSNSNFVKPSLPSSICLNSCLRALSAKFSYGHSFILLEFAHSTVTNKVSSTNPTTRTRPSIDSLLARSYLVTSFKCRSITIPFFGRGDAVIKYLLVKDAMLHETNDMLLDFKITLHFHYEGKFEERHNKIHYVGEIGCTKLDYDYDKLSLIELGSLLKEDCNYKGNVTELWWRNSRGGSELRRIIGDKEIVDMTPKLRKCNIVHIYVIEKPPQGLTLPLVTYNFVNENEVIDQNNTLFEPSLTTNLERAGKTNVTYASQTPIENRDVSTPTNGRDGSTTPARKNSAKARFLAPDFLCHGRLSSRKMPSWPKSSVGQNLSEQHLINALGVDPKMRQIQGRKMLESVRLQSQKQNDVANAQKDNDSANSQKDNDTTNAQKENVIFCLLKIESKIVHNFKHDILQAHSDKKKGCENSASSDAVIGGGKLTVTRNAINPSENDSSDNEGVKQFGKLHVECSVSSVQPICCLLSMLKWSRSFLVRHFLDKFEGGGLEHRRTTIMRQAR